MLYVRIDQTAINQEKAHFKYCVMLATTSMSQVRDDHTSVLVVDDDPEVGEVFADHLRDEFEVQLATSGPEALELLKDSVDVVLLDRRMPTLSGDDVVTELRNRGNDVPVALVTAVEPDADVIDLPVDEYLTKPVDRESLKRTVQVLANRAAFEEKSREFFQLAMKRASLDSHTDDMRFQAAEELQSRLVELQSELNETIGLLKNGDARVVQRNDPGPEEVETLLTEVWEHELPDNIRRLVEEYQTLEAARPPFMWKWVHRLAPNNTLPCVDDRFVDDVPVDKTITILFITLLDDVLEKMGDEETFSELAKIPSSNRDPDPDRSEVNTECVRFGMRVWTTLCDRIQRAPHYTTYEDLFRYDIKQAINAIEYTNLAIEHPNLITMADLERYESHNMVMFAYADIDLMHSPSEVQAEFSNLREAIWDAQIMARIGNWVSTWERELKEGDFSGGAIVSALEQDVVSVTELRRATTKDALAEELIDRIKSAGIEKQLLHRWEREYHQLTRYNEDLSTVDLDPFIEGMEEVLRYHLASTGLK